jgi:hypothetical protein
MNPKLKLKLALLYMKYRRYLVPAAVAAGILFVVVCFFLFR